MQEKVRQVKGHEVRIKRDGKYELAMSIILAAVTDVVGKKKWLREILKDTKVAVSFQSMSFTTRGARDWKYDAGMFLFSQRPDRIKVRDHWFSMIGFKAEYMETALKRKGFDVEGFKRRHDII